MDLILWRHAQAVTLPEPVEGEPPHDHAADLARPLTLKGERQAERMAAWLNQRLSAVARPLKPETVGFSRGLPDGLAKVAVHQDRRAGAGHLQLIPGLVGAAVEGLGKYQGGKEKEQGSDARPATGDRAVASRCKMPGR